jgi:hypothetical protein
LRKKRNPDNFDIDAIVSVSENYSPAEIEKAINTILNEYKEKIPSELKDEIEIVGTIITKIENNENTMEYFFDTSEILEEY